MLEESTREGFGRGLAEAGEADARVVALTGDLNDSTKVEAFAKKFPGRFVQAGIAEQNMVAMAAGLAIAGKVPFAASFGAFLPARCFDQIRVSVALSNLNVKLAATHCGVTTGEDGANAQMLEDIALMRSLPNFTVIAPCDGEEARKATVAAASIAGPMYLRLGRERVPHVSGNGAFTIGKAVTLHEGSDVAIIANGVEVAQALEAAKALAAKGVSARVINLHTIKPLDENTLVKAAAQCGCVVTAEEHQLQGGVGSAVAELLAERRPTPIEMVAVRSKFGESGKPAELLKKFGLDAKGIERAALRALARRK
ncbi:MAG: transketolase C-terminal domain-containing protein [Candidatus Micrarchaeota archaeon]